MKNIITLLSILIIISCSEDDGTNNNPDQPDPVVYENVVPVLKENAQIISTTSELSDGIYIIEFSGDAPLIVANDIIVGDEGEGFLRKVTTVSSNGNIFTMETSQARMEDVFEVASIEFTTDISEQPRLSNGGAQNININHLSNGVRLSEDGLEYDFSNVVIYDDNGLTFAITNGTATFNPNYSFRSDYSLLEGVSYMDFRTNNATLDIDCDLSLSATGEINLPSFSETLVDYDIPITILLAGIPIKVTVNTKLVAELNASVASTFELTTGFTNNYSVTAGVRWQGSIWESNLDYGAVFTPKPVDISSEVSITQNLTITPKVDIKFYGVIGPYTEPKVTEDFTINIHPLNLSWNANLKAGGVLKFGINMEIFGYTVLDIGREAQREETIWSSAHVGGWYKGTYTLQHLGMGNTMHSCGTQNGATGTFYVYVGELNQSHQIVVYTPSILPGIPNFYKQGFYLYDEFNDPNSIQYQEFGHAWYEDLGIDPNNPSTDGSTNLYREFSLNWFTFTNNGNTLISSEENPSPGNTAKRITSGTGTPICSDTFSGSAYAFRYNVINISANYLGEDLPSDLSTSNWDKINTILENDSISVILE